MEKMTSEDNLGKDFIKYGGGLKRVISIFMTVSTVTVKPRF